MKDADYVILTVKGWDGSRILGIFSSIEEATRFRDQFTKNNEPNGFNDEFYIDVMKLGQTSNSCEILMTPEDMAANTITRKHIYL